MITVRRPSGLVVPFDPPELTAEAAAARSWEVPEGGTLLEPKRESQVLWPEVLPGYRYSALYWAAWHR